MALKASIVEVAIRLSKFPHEVREQMDADDFALVMGHAIAGNIEQAEAMNKRTPGAAKAKPQTMG